MRFTHKSHHFLRSLRKPWKLGMRVQQLVLSCARSRITTEIERKHIMRKHRKKNICMTAWNPLPVGVFSIVFCIASYSIFFSPAAWQSSGPNNNHWRLISTWASREQNNRETCFIYLYKAIQINEWDNIMIINDWRK